MIQVPEERPSSHAHTLGGSASTPEFFRGLS